jgi:hypothetical protein
MRMSFLCSIASIALASGAAFAQGEGEFPATLKGHALLPAQSFVDVPADAPDDLRTAGKYTQERPTGVSLPFKGQPLQGHSGIKVMPDGSFWLLTDNGMGSRFNSADSMLHLNRHKIDWASGKIDRQETIFLHDPTGRYRSASCMRTPPSAISPAPISILKACRLSATLSGSARNSDLTS